MSRYETLNVSLQNDTVNNKNNSRLSNTIEYGQEMDTQNDNNETDQRVRKFRELYYKNQNLRKQLKVLNARLNDRLQKVKFPVVRKKSASVDLNRQPPNKALQRELENAYKQVTMYKNQVQILKIKQETPESYGKMRDMENLISYRDKEIADVQEQLKSIKNVKKLQQRKIVSQLQNQQVKERLQSYEKQFKELKDKMKQIGKKSRKREEQYKKQQAYLVSLSKKYRITNADQRGIDEAGIAQLQKSEHALEVSDVEFRIAKQEITNQKRTNDQILKKFEALKKHIKAVKQQNHQNQEKFKEKQALAKMLQTKIISLNRLLREDQRKPKEPPKNDLILNIEDAKMDNLHDSFSEMEDIHKEVTVSKDNMTVNKMLEQMQGEQREWKGKHRKVQHGFGAPNDKKFQLQGSLTGLQVSLDQNEAICGISFIIDNKNGFLHGKRSNIELMWQLGSGDRITKISGSFTQQSYLHELIVNTKNGHTGVFGTPGTDSFTFRLTQNEQISGCFGAVRQLGSDTKIVELGLWIEKV